MSDNRIRMLVTYKVKHGKRDDFISEIKQNDIIEKSRNEQGNIKYDYFIPLENDNELLLIEEWENQLCIDQHKTTPHFLVLQIIKAEYVEDVIFE